MNQRGAARYGVITFLLVVLILLMAGILVVMLYGDRIRSRFNVENGRLEFTGAEGSGYAEELEGDGEEGEETAISSDGTADGTVEEQPEPEPVVEEVPETPPEPALPDYASAAQRPDGLSLYSGSRKVEDFTVRTAGAVTKLRAEGGNGNYAWVSQNPDVASVDQSGNVTAVSNGKTNVLVTDGEKKAVCIVRVSTGHGNSEESGNQLNRSDFTRKVSEGPYQLYVEGVSEGVSWRSTNTSVATVSNSGLVTPVGRGSCDIIASWGAQSRVCTVRVPKE